MRLFLNRLSVLAKRSFINPAMYVMSAVILLMALLVIFVPEKDTYIYLDCGATCGSCDNMKTLKPGAEWDDSKINFVICVKPIK